eukprot:m.166075 g.166075  ORF g.166075 m.166075 type:complete len:405 (-) comp12644_c0_seq1:284-1498(-)
MRPIMASAIRPRAAAAAQCWATRALPACISYVQMAHCRARAPERLLSTEAAHTPVAHSAWDVPNDTWDDWQSRAVGSITGLSQPAVFRGLGHAWVSATRQAWNNKILSTMDHVTLTASYGPSGSFDCVNPEHDRVEFAALEDMPLPRFIKLIEAEARDASQGDNDGLASVKERTYAGEARTTAFARALLPLLPTPSWHPGWPDDESSAWFQPFFSKGGAPGEQSQATVWMSAGDTTAPAHRDQWFNLSCALEGTKTFYLVPPQCHEAVLDIPRPCARLQRRAPGDYVAEVQTDALGDTVFTSGHSPLNFSAALQGGTSIADFPITVVTLGPGDVMYLPPDWYHQVESNADDITHRSVAVNFWSSRLFGWTVDDIPGRATRLSDILSRHPSPPQPPSPPWESFMD